MKIRMLLITLVILSCGLSAIEIVTDEDMYQGLQRIVWSTEDAAQDAEHKALLETLKTRKAAIKEQIDNWCMQCKHAPHFSDCLALYKHQQFTDQLEQKMALNVVMAKVETFFSLINLRYDIRDDAFDDLMRLAIVGLRTKKQQKTTNA